MQVPLVVIKTQRCSLSIGAQQILGYRTCLNNRGPSETVNSLTISRPIHIKKGRDHIMIPAHFFSRLNAKPVLSCLPNPYVRVR